MIIRSSLGRYRRIRRGEAQPCPSGRDPDSRRVFRFAPSPNGYLHRGHAYSALLNQRAAEATGGRFLLRIEDIDRTRAREEFEAAIFEDLAWLGLRWEEPVLRQRDRFDAYARRSPNSTGSGCSIRRS